MAFNGLLGNIEYVSGVFSGASGYCRDVLRDFIDVIEVFNEFQGGFTRVL